MPVRPPVPPVVEELARRAHAAGGRALLVGGGVRDFLMGRGVKDWDVEVHGIEEPDLAELLAGLGTVNTVGRSFGVFKLAVDGDEVDVSLPRRDSNAGPGHRGIRVEGDPHMGLEEAARRRDLTVNAIMIDIRTGEILDPFGGQADLEAGILRAVDADTFLEDPLRALRVVQFAARLAFAVDDELVALCRRASLSELPAERIQEEWRKLLLRADTPSVGLQVARDTAVLERALPEAAASDHPRVDTVVDRMARRRPPGRGRAFTAMLAAWLHRADPDQVTATLDRLWLHTWRGYKLRDRTLDAVATWPEAPGTDAALRHLSTRTDLDVTLRLRWAVTGDPAALDALDRARELGIHHAPPDPVLLGRHLKPLGIPPGPQMGEILDHVYQRQLDGAIQTLDQARRAARRWWRAREE